MDGIHSVRRRVVTTEPPRVLRRLHYLSPVTI